MSIFVNYISTKMKDAKTNLIKAAASWDPEAVGESQLAEWNDQAEEMAEMAASAQIEYNSLLAKLASIKNNYNDYVTAAETLATKNPTAANKAADQAMELMGQINVLDADVADAKLWMDETRSVAEAAQEKVRQGRDAIERAIREQKRATQEAATSKAKLEQRERMAGITSSVDGIDVAINAMKSNVADAKKESIANNIRSGVLNRGADEDTAIQDAIKASKGQTAPTTLTDKLASLKKIA